VPPADVSACTGREEERQRNKVPIYRSKAGQTDRRQALKRVAIMAQVVHPVKNSRSLSHPVGGSTQAPVLCVGTFIVSDTEGTQDAMVLTTDACRLRYPSQRSSLDQSMTLYRSTKYVPTAEGFVEQRSFQLMSEQVDGLRT